jgi:hypothetical protein
MPVAITPGTRAIPMITLSHDRVATEPGWLAAPRKMLAGSSELPYGEIK